MTSMCLKIITLYIQIEDPSIIIFEPSDCQLEFNEGRITGMCNKIISNLQNCENQNDNTQLWVAPVLNNVTRFIINEAIDTYRPTSISEQTQFFRVKQYYLTRITHH